MVRKRIILFVSGVLFFGCRQHSKDHIAKVPFNTEDAHLVSYLSEQIEEGNAAHELFYKRARAFYHLNKLTKALNDINRAIKDDTENHEYYFLKGRICSSMNEPQQAIENLLLAENLGLKSNVLYNELTSQYLKLEKYREAMATAQQMVKLQPSAAAHLLHGKVKLALKDTAQAIASFKKSLELNSKNREAYTYLSDIYFIRNDFARSGKYINQYLDIAPDDNAFNLRKGRLLLRLDEYDSAKLSYATVMAQDSSGYMVYFELSDVYYQQGRYDSAAILSRRAYMLNNDFLEAKLVMARAQERQRQYQEAISTYEGILQQDSTFNLARSELADLKRKVAYLWHSEQKKQASDSAPNNPPPAVRKKEIEN